MKTGEQTYETTEFTENTGGKEEKAYLNLFAISTICFCAKVFYY
jgi:hypothetical protein